VSGWATLTLGVKLDQSFSAMKAAFEVAQSNEGGFFTAAFTIQTPNVFLKRRESRRSTWSGIFDPILAVSVGERDRSREFNKVSNNLAFTVCASESE
jgi:hypothetical protein